MHRFKNLVSATVPTAALFSLVWIASFPISAAPASLDKQRAIYQQAQNYLDKKQVSEYLQIRNQIADYPLTPYVDYRTFLLDIGKRTPEEVNAFVLQHQDFPFSNTIRVAYLDALIADENWRDFYQFQTQEPNSEAYRCSYYYAQLKNGNKEIAYKGAEELWLSGESISDNCEALFSEWQQAGLRTDDLVLRRMLLGFERKSHRLINYLAKMPSSEESIQQANELKHLALNPDYVIEFSQTREVSTFNQKKAEIALEQLARTDVELAFRALPIVFKAQQFPLEVQQSVSEVVAVRLFETEETHLAQWRDQVLSQSQSTSIIERRIRLAIRQADWAGVAIWIGYLSKEEADTLRWQYWLGRSELERGFQSDGVKRLQGILGKRNFYSVAAANALDKPFSYKVNNSSTSIDILKPYRTSLVRIKELIDLDKISVAKSEWNWLLWQVGEQEKEALAVYAAKQRWHHLSVQATIEAKMWDNTALRFPLAHQWWFNFYGDKHKVDPITLMSVARQESAMDVEAHSPVGARGIMQIMPRTAKYTAKKYKLDYSGASDLYDVGKNIEIGSKYLNSLMEQYDQNRIFALAAYNAGPHRVKIWRERSAQQLDPFAFIESIPFTETRGYVQNILMFETYYRDLMNIKGDFLHSNELSSKY